MKKKNLIRLKLDILRFLPDRGKEYITGKESDALLMKLHKYLKRQNFIMIVNKYKLTTTDDFDDPNAKF